MPLLRDAEHIYIHNSDFDTCVLANEIHLTYDKNNPLYE